MAFNDLIAQKIKDFEQQGFHRSLSETLIWETHRSQSATTS